MRYRVMGHLNTTDITKINGVINKYMALEKAEAKSGKDDLGNSHFTVDLQTIQPAKKNGMFADFKMLVDEYGGSIDWHECTHDEPIPKPCTVAETYRK